MRTIPPGRGIDARELRELSAQLVTRHHLDLPRESPRKTLLTGCMKVIELEPGMWLRLADVQDHYGLVTRAELPAGIKIALVVEGAARVRYGGQGAELGPSGTSRGLVVLMPAPGGFARHGERGGHERTVTLSLSPQWLACHGLGDLLEEVRGQQPRLSHWAPSQTLLGAAAQLFLSDGHAEVPLRHMQLNGFALMLASEALAHARHDTRVLPGAPDCPRFRQDRRMARLIRLIHSGQARYATQADLAGQLGMSLSNLQRHFRAQFGEALGHYLRRHYLELARKALCHGQVSIEVAADLAGYTSAPNFATAFRREFGMTPSDCRREGIHVAGRGAVRIAAGNPGQ